MTMEFVPICTHNEVSSHMWREGIESVRGNNEYSVWTASAMFP
jgi:hypothetical protein